MRLLLIATTTLAFALLSTVAAGTTLYVDDNALNDPGPGDPTVSDPLEDGTAAHPYDAIQEALDAAALTGDTITVRNGTYTGDGNRDLDFNGKAATLQSENGAASTIIDCGGTPTEDHRGFYFHSGETALSVVDGFTIQNGWVGAGSSGRGGGIYCDGSSPMIANCVITRNKAVTEYYHGEGGGIYCKAGNPAMINCVISDNIARGGSRGDGGGIFSTSSTPAITNCIIAGNAAPRGGGIYCVYKSARITNCTIIGNRATFGAGMYSDGSVVSILKNCILWNDGQEEILVDGDEPTLAYCNVRGGWQGNGNIDLDPLLTPDAHLQSGSPCINVGTSSDAPGFDRDGEPRPFPAGGEFDIGADEFVDVDSDGLPDWWETLHYPDAAGDPDGDGLANLREYEHGTDPHVADTDGDGRDDGDEVAASSNPLHPDNAAKTYYVNGVTGDDAYDGMAAAWDGVHGPKATIQAGIDAAVGGWGYAVLVADGVYAGPGNKDLNFNGKGLMLRSENGSNACVIDCEHSGRGFSFVFMEQADAVVDGFTICNGNVDGEGGGIYCWGSSPTIANCIITDNVAGNHFGGFCAGSYSAPTVTNCIIKDNSATFGGGIGTTFAWQPWLTIASCTITGNSAKATGGVGCVSGTMTLTDCTITGNHGDWQAGGVSCNTDTTLTLIDCWIEGNTAAETGGLYCHGDVTLLNCMIIGNEADDKGGGVLATGVGTGDVVITNCTISQNVPSGLHGEDRDLTLVNCIVWGNTVAFPRGGTVSYSCVQDDTPNDGIVYPGTGNIDADPLFVDAAGGDYRLQLGSPCIDAATSDGAPERDMQGAPRWDERTVPNTGGGDRPWYDIGAYEFYRGKRRGLLIPHPGQGQGPH